MDTHLVAWYGALVATYAALIATFSACISAFNALRDTARVHINCSPCRVSRGIGVVCTGPVFVAKVVNSGRRPILITGVYFRKNRFGKDVYPSLLGPGEARLGEGESAEYIADLAHAKKNARYIVAIDSTGKRYVRAVPKGAQGILKAVNGNGLISSVPEHETECSENA